MCANCEAERQKRIEAGLLEVTEIGTVSEGLRQAFKAHNITKRLAQLDLEQENIDARRRVILEDLDEVAVTEIQAALCKEITTTQIDFDSQHAALWNRAYVELDLVGKEQERAYNVDIETGLVTREDRKSAAASFAELLAQAIFGPESTK